MRRSFLMPTAAAFFASAVTLSGQNPVPRIATTAIDRYFVRSEIVIKGRVVGFEEGFTEAKLGAGPRMKVRVAVVESDESFKGAAKLTHLRVACATSDQPMRDKKGRLRPTTTVRHSLLSPISEDDAGIFFLEATDSACLFGLGMSTPLPDDQSPRFEAELVALREIAEITADPLKAISGKDELENYAKLYRFLYLARTSPTEEASAELSKRILTMVGDMSPTGIDRNKAPYGFSSYAIKLRLGSADGFELPVENGRPVSGTKRYEAMHNWIKENASTHRLKLSVR